MARWAKAKQNIRLFKTATTPAAADLVAGDLWIDTTSTATLKVCTTAATQTFSASATSADKLSAFAATTSLELKGVISDETGSGALVFAETPTLVSPVLGVATGTSFNSITGVATQAEQETASSITASVSPGRQQFHPSACKCWVQFVGASGSISASYNVSSVTDVGTGTSTINIGTDMSSGTFCVVATTGFQTGVTEDGRATIDTDTALAVGTIPVTTHGAVIGTRADVAMVWCAVFGDQ